MPETITQLCAEGKDLQNQIMDTWTEEHKLLGQIKPSCAGGTLTLLVEKTIEEKRNRLQERQRKIIRRIYSSRYGTRLFTKVVQPFYQKVHQRLKDEHNPKAIARAIMNLEICSGPICNSTLVAVYSDKIIHHEFCKLSIELNREPFVELVNGTIGDKDEILRRAGYTTSFDMDRFDQLVHENTFMEQNMIAVQREYQRLAVEKLIRRCDPLSIDMLYELTKPRKSGAADAVAKLFMTRFLNRTQSVLPSHRPKM